jgi:hypothetical protein
MWSTSNTNVEIIAAGATSPHPAIPSSILTVTQQSGIMAGTGITGLGKTGSIQTGAVQTLAVGTSGTDFDIVSSGNTQTFNIPTASASNRGALSSADWTAFNGKQAALPSGTNGQVLALSGGSPVWSTSKGAFGVTFDGQGGVVSVGKTDWISIPYNCTITGWEITADQVGSCVIDVWKSTFAAFPPTAANSIAGSEKPTLAITRTNRDLLLSPPWAAVTAGDCIMFYVDSCSVLTKINLIIYTNIII